MEPPPPYPPVTASDIPKLIGLVQDFFREKLEKSDGDTILEDDDLPRKERFPKPRLPPTGKISSPRKRPIREQQQIARKKKKAEIEASREMERLREQEANGGVDAAVAAAAVVDSASTEVLGGQGTSDGQTLSMSASDEAQLQASTEESNNANGTADLVNGNSQPPHDEQAKTGTETHLATSPDTPTRHRPSLADLSANDIFDIPDDPAETNGATDPEKKLQPAHASLNEASNHDTEHPDLVSENQDHNSGKDRQTPNGTSVNGDSAHLTNGTSSHPPPGDEQAPTKSKNKATASANADTQDSTGGTENEDDGKILSPGEGVPIAAH